MRRSVFVSLAALSSLVVSASLASAAPQHARCDRAIRYEALDGALKTRLANGETVGVPTKSDTQYNVAYVYRLVDLDAELLQAVFSSYGEQKDHFPRIKESTIEEEKGNWARIRYEADTGHWYVPNSHYTVNDVVAKDGSTYLLAWDLVHSEGLTKVVYIDGYMRTEPVGSRALMVYCNYVIPDIKMSPDQVNREGLEALKGTVDQLVEWTTAVNSGDRAQANAYLERYRRMIGQ